MQDTKQGKHTPGPWHAAHVGDCGRNSEIPVYDICDEHNWRLAEIQHEANARLIAAAPDGYNLARLILETNDVPEGPIRHAARELLTKVG